MKSFKWHGYSCDWYEEDTHPHNGAGVDAHFTIYRGAGASEKPVNRGEYIGSASNENAAKWLIRKSVIQRLREAQDEFYDVVLELDPS